MGLRPSVCFIFSAIILIGAFACGRADRDEKVAESPVVTSLSSAEAVKLGLGRLPEWVAYWRSQGFQSSLDDFGLDITNDLELPERPEVNPLAGSGNALEPYQLSHPGGNGTVDIYDYKIRITEAGDLVYEPDAEVIYYKESGMRERLLFIGPSGLFEDAVWVDTTKLLVVGYFEEDDGFTPILWLVNLEQGKYGVFKTPFKTATYPRHGYLEKKLKLDN